MEINDTNILWLVFMAITAFILMYKKITKSPDAITSSFQMTKKIKGLPQDNLKLIRQALKNAGFNKVGIDEEEHYFYARSKFSMSSFLEYIEVYYQNTQNKTELKFKSICALPTQIYDWGKNKRNFKNFEKELDQLVGKQKTSLS